MTKTERFEKIKELLIRDYPKVETPLKHEGVFQLLVSVMLSAQTLDATVNKITPALFKKYKNVNELANAKITDVEKLIHGVNFHKTKAIHLIEMAKMLIEKFNSEVPSKMEELIQLPGVGRKTANVVIGEWFYKEQKDAKYEQVGFVVDTHVRRVSQRLGFTKNTTPEKIEPDLVKLFPRDECNIWSLRIILHGRYRCKAQNPQCIKDPEWSKVCGCCNLSNEL
jgi:endonuclease-3